MVVMMMMMMMKWARETQLAGAGAGCWVLVRVDDEKADVPVRPPVETCQSSPASSLENNPRNRPIRSSRSMPGMVVVLEIPMGKKKLNLPMRI
jgi:hypothetical protein